MSNLSEAPSRNERSFRENVDGVPLVPADVVEGAASLIALACDRGSGGVDWQFIFNGPVSEEEQVALFHVVGVLVG